MTSKSLILTQYPLTTSYISRFHEHVAADTDQVVVTNIDVGNFADVVRYFRSLKARALYVPLSDVNMFPLLPPLQILAMLIKAERRFVVWSDFTQEEFGFPDAFYAGARIAVATIGSAFVLLRDWLRLRRLLHSSRIAVRDSGKKTILYLKTNLWLGVGAGGSIAHTSGVVNSFVAHGYEVDFASAESPVAIRQDEMVHIRKIAPPDAYVIPRELNHYRHNASFTKALHRSGLGDRGFIYQRMSVGNFTGVMFSRRWHLPMVLEYNGSEVWLAKNWGSPLVMEKLSAMAESVNLRHAHLVVTVSEVLRQQLIENGVDPDRVVVCPNGVDPDLFDPGRFSPAEIKEVRQKLGVGSDRIVITFVGTFGPWHGAEILAETIGWMAKTDLRWLTENKLHFVFIGDGGKRSNVERILSLPELQSVSSITGLIAQEETPTCMVASDILVSPHVPNPDGSAFFGSPTKLFEYLAAGKPVVASDLNQIGDVLEGCPHLDELERTAADAGKNACGILVTPGDREQLGRAIRFLVENSHWRAKAGENARARALERYTWRHHVDTIIDGYERVLQVEERPLRRPFHVLINGLHSKSGGGVTYLKNLLPILAKDPRIDLHVCIHGEQQDLLPQGLDNTTVHMLDFRLGFWRLLMREQIDVSKLARGIGADVTFSPANYGPLWAPNSVILLRNALSVAFVERRPTKLAYWALVYLGTFLSLLVSRRAITVSEYARNAASGGLIGFFENRLTVIPHGVADMFSPPTNGAERDGFLLAVSDLYVQKNLANLIHAMTRLDSDHADVTLKIAGRPVDLEYFAQLKKIVAEANLDGQVEFLGEVPPNVLVDLYRRCNIFVFPSTVETFGNPLVEAMACGAPIACSETAAMPEVAGDAAEFFDPRDPDSIASTLDRLLNNASLRRKLSEKAVNRARRFSWEATAAQTLDVILGAATLDEVSPNIGEAG